MTLLTLAAAALALGWVSGVITIMVAEDRARLRRIERQRARAALARDAVVLETVG